MKTVEIPYEQYLALTAAANNDLVSTPETDQNIQESAEIGGQNYLDLQNYSLMNIDQSQVLESGQNSFANPGQMVIILPPATDGNGILAQDSNIGVALIGNTEIQSLGKFFRILR